MEFSHKSKSLTNDHFLTEIAINNLIKENQFLVENGFIKLKKNLKFLLKYDKDQEKALAALLSKKYEKKELKGSKLEKELLFQKKIEETNFSEQNNFLLKCGFCNPKRKFKKLFEYDGNQDLALESLIKHNEKQIIRKEEKQMNCLQELEKQEFSTRHQELVSKGFTDPKLNLRLLVKYKGDLNKVLNKIEGNYEKKQPRNNVREGLSIEKIQNMSICKEVKKKFKEENGNICTKKIDSEINQMYLDGNNMLFVDEKLRKLCLSRRKSVSEKLIANLAIELGKKLGLEEIILIFDNSKNIYKTTIDSLNLCVVSAKPDYETSDDALVNWMEKKESFENILIVTSDIGLQSRLKDKGVKHIIKSGNWFKLVKENIGQENYNMIVSNEESSPEQN